MGMFSFGHRGRDRHVHACERCSGPVYDVRQRWCEVCRVSGGPSNRDHWDEALDLDAPIDEPMLEPPLEYPDLPTIPTLPTLRTIEEQAEALRRAKEAQARQRELEQDAEARHAEQRAAYVDRLAWIAYWRAKDLGWDDIPWPKSFELDAHCPRCRAIIGEQTRDGAYAAPIDGDYLCLRHATNWRDYDPETGEYRPAGGSQTGQEAAQ